MNTGPSESGFHFMQDYLRCQQYFYWRYHLDLEPLFLSPSLLFGRNLHEALAAWYESLREGDPVQLRVKKAVERFKQVMYESQAEYMMRDTYDTDFARGMETLTQYGLHYPVEPWQVIAVEEELEYWTPTGTKFTGRVDLAVRTPDRRMHIVDHKTTRWGFLNLIRSLNVTDQACGYLWLWNKTHPDEQVESVIFNIIRQYQGNPEFKQHAVIKTAADLERFEADTGFLLNEIATKMSNVGDPDIRFVRDTSACFKYNRPCPYLELCQGDNYKGLIGSIYRQRTGDEQVYVETEE